MIALNELHPPAVALDWHEAVAVVAALAALVDDAGAAACPLPSQVELRPSGDLRVTGPRVLEGTAAQGLAAVLAQLLASTPCPAELRQLLDAYADDAPAGADAVAQLGAQLAFFERPGRRGVLEALALRVGPAVERARSAAALDALTARTRQPSGSHDRIASPPPAAPTGVVRPAPPVERRPVMEPGQGRLVLAGAVVFALCLAGAFVAASWLDAPKPVPSRAANEPPEEDLPMSGPGFSRPATAPKPAGRLPATPSATRGPAPPPGGGAATATAVPAPPPGTTAPASPTEPVPPTRTPVDIVVAERDGRALPPAVEPVRPAPRTPPAGRVFTQADPLVTPAILIRPHLPDQPPADVPEEQIGTLEFVVAESGAVEHVHLISPANRYQERMLVAAAKTWQFQPAMREGRPVRYRTRIRVTL
jgi:hypothetical protein